MPLTDAHVWLFFWLHIGVILVVTAYYLLAAAVWPNMAARGAARFGRRWWLATLIGVLVSAPLVLGSAVFANLPPLQFIGVILFLGWIMLGLFGGAGIALHVGRHGQAEVPAARAALRGGLMISLSWALPLIGWFFILPLTIATGIGCLILGWIPVRTTPETIQALKPGAGGSDETGFSFADRA